VNRGVLVQQVEFVQRGDGPAGKICDYHFSRGIRSEVQPPGLQNVSQPLGQNGEYGEGGGR
jgi:hypothetical protein